MFYNIYCYYGYTNNMKKKYLLIPIFILEILSILYLKDTYKIRQTIWFIIGLFMMFILTKINRNHLKVISITLYILCLILLIICLFLPNTNGSRGWISFKLFSIQPSEITKFSLILLSIYLTTLNKRHKLLFILIFLIPSILTFLEPDTGAVIIYLLIFLLFIKDFFSKKEIIIGSILIISIISFCIYIYLYKREIFIKIFNTSMYYRIDRLISFKDGNNIQVVNALISIGSGKLLYFPEANNDFFFSYLVTLNSINFYIIILSYLTILIILSLYNEKTSKILFTIISFQVIENIGMNLSILPVIGIPLPFLSYGGSHTISYFLILGLFLYPSNNHNMKSYKYRAAYSMDLLDKDYNKTSD